VPLNAEDQFAFAKPMVVGVPQFALWVQLPIADDVRSQASCQSTKFI
jgi:hypothetical protein